MATSKHTQQTLDEKRLFHGTSPDTVEAICKQNFDWRLHGKNATAYGEGSYFAKNASYSHAFARKDANSTQFMFVAKVLVGSYTTGHSSYRRPPLKKPFDPASDLYDSCVNNQSNPTVFVVFDTDQFYPEYIIEYSTASQATSASAYAVPQLTSAPIRLKTTTSISNTGIQGQPAPSMNLIGTYSNLSRSRAAQSGNSSTTVNPRANTHPPNSTRRVPRTTSSASVLRSGHPATVLSTTAPKSSTSLSTVSSQSRSTGSAAAQSVNSSTTVNPRANTLIPNSTRLDSTTTSSASVLRSGHLATVLSSSAPRTSTASCTVPTQRRFGGQSGYHTSAFDSSYFGLPSSASQSAAQNASPASVSNAPHATLSNSRSSTSPSIPSSTSPNGSFKDTSANVSPQKKKEKCLIS